METVTITLKRDDTFLTWIAEHIDDIFKNELLVKIIYSEYVSAACDSVNLFITDDYDAIKKFLLKKEYNDSKKTEDNYNRKEIYEAHEAKKALEANERSRQKKGQPIVNNKKEKDEPITTDDDNKKFDDAVNEYFYDNERKGRYARVGDGEAY